MVRLNPDQRRLVWFDNGVVSAAINFVLSGVIGWPIFRGSPVPVRGVPKGVAVDFVSTCFLLPAATTVIVTTLVRRRVRDGRVDRLAKLPPVLRPVSRPLAARAVLLGSLATGVLGAPLAAGLILWGGRAWSPETFVIAKSVFAGALAWVVTPVIAAAALADPPRPVPEPSVVVRRSRA